MTKKLKIIMAGLAMALIVSLSTLRAPTEPEESISIETPTQFAGRVVAPHVIKLEARDIDNVILGTGTGFYVMYNNFPYILTNKHMCEEFKSMDILKDENASMTMTARMRYRVSIEGLEGNLHILKISNNHDLCLLRANKNQGLQIADRDIAIYDSVTVTGHPRGLPLTIRHGSVISTQLAVFPWISNEEIPFSMIDIIAYGGNSGSPITNSDGELVGVLFGGFRKEHTEAFIVPLTDIKLFLLQFSMGR